MNNKDLILKISNIALYALPILLVIAIVVMFLIKPNNVDPVSTTGQTENSVTQSSDAAAEDSSFDETESSRLTEPKGTEEIEESKDMDSFIAENVQFGAVPGADDGALDDSVTGSTAPDQSSGDTNPATDSDAPQILDSRLDPLHPDFDITLLTYEDYIAMDGDRQRAVVEAFSTPEMFIKWYHAVEDRYKAEHPDIEIGEDGIIDGKDLAENTP